GTLAKEETWEDYSSVKKRLATWSIADFTHSFEPHVKYLLLSASTHIFGNIRVIPFITSIAANSYSPNMNTLSHGINTLSKTMSASWPANFAFPASISPSSMLRVSHDWRP